MLESFPVAIHDEADHPLACPLPPRHDPSLPSAVDEARGLRPAWERARSASGSTQVGRVVSADEIPDAIAAFVRVAEATPWTEAGIPGDPAAVAMDIRAYYEEVALALADHVPAARAAESWFYRSTETGAVMKAALAALVKSDPSFPALIYLVPWSQQSIIPIPRVLGVLRTEEGVRVGVWVGQGGFFSVCHVFAVMVPSVRYRLRYRC